MPLMASQGAHTRMTIAGIGDPLSADPSSLILRMFPGLEDASLYALHHHENVDGTGYPAGLQGNEIPIVSRIVSVIDAYDAMVTSRCYRKGLPHAEATRRLVESAGAQFDADVVHTFIPIAEQEATEVFAAAGTSTSAAL